MVIDDNLVITAELEGLRRLARLPRPKVKVVQEDVPGASCIWSQSDTEGGHRDMVRLRPNSGVPMMNTLRAIRESTHRLPGGHLELRGAESSFAPETELLEKLGARENLTLPTALMTRDLGNLTGGLALTSPQLSVMVAVDAESLTRLRSVVAQAFTTATADEADGSNVEADFFHAPETMTYLAVKKNDSVISTGSILVVDGVANVWSVATLPSARGQGAATAIMEAICIEAKRQGAAVAALRTTDELARDGGLYNKVGFTLVGHEQIWELDHVDNLDPSRFHNPA